MTMSSSLSSLSPQVTRLNQSNAGDDCCRRRRCCCCHWSRWRRRRHPLGHMGQRIVVDDDDELLAAARGPHEQNANNNQYPSDAKVLSAAAAADATCTLVASAFSTTLMSQSARDERASELASAAASVGSGIRSARLHYCVADRNASKHCSQWRRRRRGRPRSRLRRPTWTTTESGLERISLPVIVATIMFGVAAIMLISARPADAKWSPDETSGLAASNQPPLGSISTSTTGDSTGAADYRETTLALLMEALFSHSLDDDQDGNNRNSSYSERASKLNNKLATFAGNGDLSRTTGSGDDSLGLVINWPNFILALVLIMLMLTTAIGNLFVIVAILIERNLRTVGNYLVLSLAIADLLVACLVMPLAGIYQILQRWTLGVLLCDIWTSADVFCCTGERWILQT